MAKTSQIWEKNINIQAQQTQHEINTETTLWHNIPNFHKRKTKRILKAAREKWIITHKGSSIKVRTDYSSETWKPGDSGLYIQTNKRKNYQSRIW